MDCSATARSNSRSGQITSLAAGAQLTLDGNDAFIEDSTALGSNSALTGLASIGAGATFDLENGASVSTTGALTNNGSISIASATEELAGAVGGTGSFSLQNANLQFNSSVSAGQTINETGADALILKQAQSFAATISGFGTGDTIDATNFLAPPATTYNFVENIAGTGGTLTLTDTSCESDRQYPDDRRLFELEFHPRPRQRDRHAGEVRLSRRRRRGPKAGIAWQSG